MLMKVALCEDVLCDQEHVKLLVQSWAQKTGHEVQLRIFADTHKLLGAIDNGFEAFDCYLLDIEMREKHEGFDLARIIRKQSEHIPIVFITSHKEKAFCGYDVQALHFIAKPIQEQYLFTSLDRVARILEQRNARFLSCTIDGKYSASPYTTSSTCSVTTTMSGSTAMLRCAFAVRWTKLLPSTRIASSKPCAAVSSISPTYIPSCFETRRYCFLTVSNYMPAKTISLR